jgi:[ribosomal protein S18]-alanine N-acetyltransferase
MEATAPILATCIRFAREEDLLRILAIERRCFGEQWDYYNLKASLNDVFLVYDDGGIIGFLIACCCRLAQRGMILRVAVDPEHQGKGVASALLQEAFHQLQDMRLQDVELDVDVLKAGAIHLYEKVGFKVVEVLTLDAEEDDSFYIMRKELTE